MTKDGKRNKVFLIISSGMMEMTWLYALIVLFFLMLNVSLFPLWAALIAFFVPAMITNSIKGSGRKNVQHFMLHLTLYIIILFYTIYKYGYRNELFFSLKWLRRFFQQQFVSIEGFIYLLLILSFTVFWLNGHRVANRSNDHPTIASRFDLGITMLVLTFIIAGSTDTVFPNASVLISYYFLFSILAIIISKHSNSSKVEYFKKQCNPNLIFTLIPVIVLFISWLLLFLLPQMTSAAHAGYYIMRIISNPIGRFLSKILYFIFGFGTRPINNDPINTADYTMVIPEENGLNWLGNTLHWIITWSGIALFGLLTIIIFGWMFFSFYKWLSLKKELDIEKKGFFEELWHWLRHIYIKGTIFLKRYLVKIIARQKREENISLVFKKLCKWGGYTGLPKQKFQTPLEYGKRLALFFPDSYQDIELIVLISSRVDTLVIN